MRRCHFAAFLSSWIWDQFFFFGGCWIIGSAFHRILGGVLILCLRLLQKLAAFSQQPVNKEEDLIGLVKWCPMPVPFVTGMALGEKREYVASVRNPLPWTDHVCGVLIGPEPTCLVCLCGEGVRFLPSNDAHGAVEEGFNACFVLHSGSDIHTCIYKPTDRRLMVGRHLSSGAS